MSQEYMVNNCEEVSRFIEDVLYIECEITLDDLDGAEGSVVVFDIEPIEHGILRQFILDNGYWSK